MQLHPDIAPLWPAAQLVIDPPPIAREWGDTKPPEALLYALSESTRIGMPLTLYAGRGSNGWWVLNPIVHTERMRAADELWLTVLPANYWS